METITVKKGLEFAKKLAGYSIDLLASEIAEILMKHKNNKRLTSEEKFLAGLAYSEFFISDDEVTNDATYFRAEVRRKYFLDVLGINEYELVKRVEEML